MNQHSKFNRRSTWRKRFVLAGAAALLAAVAWTGRGVADDAKVANGKGPGHMTLEQRAGHWDYTGTVFPEAVFPGDPKAQPVKLSGTLDSEFMLNSSWLVSKARGHANGTPYEFMAIAGYDAAKARYTMVEVNSLMPPPMRSDEGTYDEASGTLTWTGAKVMPGSDQPVVTKVEETVKDADTVVTHAFMKRPGSGKFVRWFDFVQKRRRGP